jgi:archaellum component FlaC
MWVFILCVFLFLWLSRVESKLRQHRALIETMIDTCDSINEILEKHMNSIEDISATQNCCVESINMSRDDITQLVIAVNRIAREINDFDILHKKTPRSFH